MNGLVAHFLCSLRLHFRNRLALLYGYLFPSVFLAAFWVLYRHEPVPLLRHMGELLTVTVLGGACFGLPTTLVSERERGVGRRYKLLPVAPWKLVASTLLARYVIIASAGALQLLLALAIGMTPPAHPVALAVAFTLTAFAFIGLGLVIAGLANTVPAVQALGQCLFLPMLIIGGIAVPLASLPEWAQTLSAFLPGRYAVASLQSGVTGGGTGLAYSPKDLLALGLIGAAGFLAGTRLFRWETGSTHRLRNLGWLLPVAGAFVLVGLLGNRRAAPLPAQEPKVLPASAELPAPAAPRTWETITADDLATLNFNVPADGSVVTPIAGPEDAPDELTQAALDELRGVLPAWPPAKVGDPVQRVRNLLSVAAVADVTQDPIERHVPLVVLAYLQAALPSETLVRLLGWIALHPTEGEVQTNLSSLGLGESGQPALVRERVEIYAVKFLMRTTGRKTPAANPPGTPSP